MKTRLDALLVEQGFASGRDKAKAMIMAGLVYVDHQKAVKPGTEYPANCNLEVRGELIPYVSRGGLKLEEALRHFPITLTGLVCLDIGASTGGFTDCMLQNGAAKVFAIDVGYGQLSWKLRQDDRVVVMERTNIRHVTPEHLQGEQPRFASVDVSFISLGLVFPVLRTLLSPAGEAVCLIKPQFEAGRDKVGKKGVVREASTHIEVIRRVVELARANDFTPAGLTWSPVRGPEGNIEYLLWLRPAEGESAITEEHIHQTVAASHEAL